MNRKRWFYLALLLLYSGILIGVQFHSHATGPDQLTAHCKSCQVSQTSYDSVQSRDLPISQPVLHTTAPITRTLVIHDLLEVSPGRAPPLG
jgi:hypothetical protein